YILAPASSLKGSGRNRSAVNSALFKYPLANPSPLVHNSPATPTGVGFSSLSNTYTLVLPIALPIATFHPTSSSALIRLQHVNVVFSVGPYPFITSTPLNSLNAFFTDPAL